MGIAQSLGQALSERIGLALCAENHRPCARANGADVSLPLVLIRFGRLSFGVKRENKVLTN